jgi:hypothetical protein
MIETVCTVKDHARFLDYARKVQVNEQNFEYLVDKLALFSKGND